jgi:hypothetical protein
MPGRRQPQVSLKTVEKSAQYAGVDLSPDRLAELIPSLQSLMHDLQALWDVDVSEAEMAVVFPVQEPEV